MSPTTSGPAKGAKKVVAAKTAKTTPKAPVGAKEAAAKNAAAKVAVGKAAPAKNVAGKVPTTKSAATKPPVKKPTAKKPAAKGEAKRPEPARPPLPPPTPKGTKDWGGKRISNQPPRAGSHFRLRSSRGR